MGLILSKKEDKKIFVAGTNIELESVYVRFEFAGDSTGKKLEIAFGVFASKEMFLEGKPLHTNILDRKNITVELKEEEEQSVSVAHDYLKFYFEKIGYSAKIE